MISNKKESKAMKKYIPCGCKCKLNNNTCNSNQKLNNKIATVNGEIHKCKNDYSWNLYIYAHVFLIISI